jgi:hypothetical protein
MDLSENGKCLFTSLQYVESSHAPYQRIRFFYLKMCSKKSLHNEKNWFKNTKLRFSKIRSFG